MGLLAAGIAHQDVETAEPLNRALDEISAEFFVTQVARNGEALAARLLDERNDLSCVRLLVGMVVDGDVGAFPSEGNSSGPTHARIATGDQCLASRQPPRALVAFLAMVRTRFHAPGKPRPGL